MYRLDRATLDAPQRLPNGQVRVDAFISRTGVFEYRQADGSVRREYRPPDEVFHADSLASFQHVTVTDDHPREMVTAQNAKGVTVGFVPELPRRDSDKVRTPLFIFDAPTIEKMERGKVEVSCGYTCDVDDEPGISPDGERYDAIQRNIRGNHVAIVNVGRAGSSVRVRIDSAVQVDRTTSAPAATTPTKDPSMEELQKQVAALTVEAAEQKVRADAAEKRVNELEAEKAKLEGERDAEKARADAAEKERTDAVSDVEIQKRVDAKTKLQTEAAKVLGDEYDFAGKSDRDVKVAVVEKVDGFKCGDEKTHPQAYVDARYDSAIERAEKSAANLKVDGDKTESKTDANGKTPRQKMIEHNRARAQA